MSGKSSSPTLETVELLARALGLSISDLLSDESPKIEPPSPSSRVARELGRVVEDFLVASPQGRRRIAKVAAEEADNEAK
jgi:transcriptional regulator with XRE-family HTH domain